MFVTLTALRMYIPPSAVFLLRLEEFPPAWKQEEMWLVNALFRGARGWTCPAVPQNLRGLGFPADMPSMESAALGDWPFLKSIVICAVCWIGGVFLFFLAVVSSVLKTCSSVLALRTGLYAALPWLSDGCAAGWGSAADGCAILWRRCRFQREGEPFDLRLSGDLADLPGLEPDTLAALQAHDRVRETYWPRSTQSLK
ncbi:unnamed protein product, partial [Prorocentrum cordatum]